MRKWNASLIEEAALFPNGNNDDRVDAFSQAINWARGRSRPATAHFPSGRLPAPPRATAGCAKRRGSRSPA